MLNFIDFITETLNKKIKYYYSPEFKRILRFIIDNGSKGNNISNLILSQEEKDSVVDDISFIDKTNKNDMVSFIQVNRIERIYNSSKKDGETLSDWILRQNQEFISGENPPIWKSQRSELAIGRFTRRVISSANIRIVNMDSQIEDFVNSYKSTYDSIRDGDSRFELVSGEDIRKWYLVSRYEKDSGQLGNSCMRKEHCQKFFNIYTENPNQVSLLILKSKEDPSKICGRALVWKSIDGKVLMDRVYTIRDSDYLLFRNYAISNSWLSGSDLSFTDLNRTVVQLDKWKFDYYPYMDTFKILNHKTGTLSPNEDLWPGTDLWKLEDTMGGHDDDDMVWSDYHNEHINRDSAILCRNGDWVYEDEAIYLEYLNEFASPQEEVVYSEYDSCYYYLDDVIMSECLDSYIYEKYSIPIVINSKLYEDYTHKDFKDLIIDIEIDGEVLKTLDKFVILDPIEGKYYFKDYEIDGKNMIDIIVDKNRDRILSKEELENYIINSDFTITKYAEKLRIIIKDPTISGSFNLFRYSASKPKEFDKIMKFVLLVSPKMSERRNGVPKIVSTSLFKNDGFRNFGNKILNERDISNMLSTESIGLLKGNDFRNLFNMVLISDRFVNDIIKDKDMLLTWYSIKG